MKNLSENLIHQFYKVNKHFMSDNFFLYNRQFPSYKPLKSVTVGSGRVGSHLAGSGRFTPYID